MHCKLANVGGDGFMLFFFIRGCCCCLLSCSCLALPMQFPPALRICSVGVCANAEQCHPDCSRCTQFPDLHCECMKSSAACAWSDRACWWRRDRWWRWLFDHSLALRLVSPLPAALSLAPLPPPLLRSTLAKAHTLLLTALLLSKSH